MRGRQDAGTVEEPVTRDFLVGPYVFEVFEFDASIATGRGMELHQTVAAAGVNITLEEVLITPSTRLVLHIRPPEPVANAVSVVVLRTPVTVIAGGSLGRVSD